MGFPIGTNIFSIGSSTQRHFARFPVQAALLFSPFDRGFEAYLRARFVELDRLTGNSLAFFAVLDPPAEWARDGINLRWWHDYRNNAGTAGFSVDDGVLLRELARRFGVPWHSLPVIVASPNLWTAEFVIAPTSAEVLRDQFGELVRTVAEVGQPDLSDIADALEQVGVRSRLHIGNRDELLDFYDILESGIPERRSRDTRGLGPAERSIRRAHGIVSQFRTSWHGTDESGGVRRSADDSTAERVIEESAGLLVPVATVAERQFGRLRDSELPSLLDAESSVMIQTALRVGRMLELDDTGRLGRQIRFGGFAMNPVTDFTPGAQGAWKAFELEINLSLVQAARLSRDIPMPTFFTKFDREHPRDRGRIVTVTESGGQSSVHVNRRDREDPDSERHRFLMMGGALDMVRTLLATDTEPFNRIVAERLGYDLPSELLSNWEQLRKIRNRASHISLLDRSHYEEALRLALDPQILHPLLKLKDKLSRSG